MNPVFGLVKESYAVEEFGLIKSAVRVDVVPVSGGTLGEVLQAALDYPGVPRPGESASTNSPHVRVIRRTPLIIGFDKNSGAHLVKVTCEYQLLRPLELLQASIEGGGSLTQILTQVDRDGNAITVVDPEADTPEDTAIQITPPIAVLEPTQSCIFDVLEYTNDPDGMVETWRGKVNNQTWKGGAAKQWLCMAVAYKMVDELASPPGYSFHYEFEKRRGYLDLGWKYTGFYQRENGEIPATASLANGGVVAVDWHDELDFGSKFPG